MACILKADSSIGFLFLFYSHLSFLGLSSPTLPLQRNPLSTSSQWPTTPGLTTLALRLPSFFSFSSPLLLFGMLFFYLLEKPGTLFPLSLVVPVCPPLPLHSLLPLTIATVEIIGYVTRYLGSRDLENLKFFIIQTLAILVAPALLAASIYMVLGRLVVLVHAETYLPVRPTWLTKIFVGGDILSFIIQIAGSGMLSSNFSWARPSSWSAWPSSSSSSACLSFPPPSSIDD